MTRAKETNKDRLIAVTLDEASIGRSSPDIDHERSVAIYDLIEENSFAPVGHKSGPYTLALSLKDNRLVFDIRREDGKPVIAHLLSLTPFKRIVKDYFLICDSYYSAIRTATPVASVNALVLARKASSSAGTNGTQRSTRREAPASGVKVGSAACAKALPIPKRPPRAAPAAMPPARTWRRLRVMACSLSTSDEPSSPPS